jgi:hypothetical protein
VLWFEPGKRSIKDSPFVYWSLLSILGIAMFAPYPLAGLKALRHRIRRLSRKGADLYATSGSLWRVAIYFCKLARNKVPFLLQHNAHDWRAIYLQRSSIRRGLKDEIRIAVATSGSGLGDLLVIARFMRDLASECREVRFDVFCADPPMAKWVFASIPGFRDAISRFAFANSQRFYPLAIGVGQVPVIVSGNTEPASISAAKELTRIVRAIRRFENENPEVVARAPYLDGYIGQKAAYSGRNRANFLHSVAGIHYGGDRYAVSTDGAVLAHLGLAGRKFITFHGGFDSSFVMSGKRATKCYPHYALLPAIIKARFPELLIVQLGIADVPRLAGCDADLRGETTLPQVAAILAQTSLHVDNEGGLVHMAACLGTTSCVIFGPTFVEYFAYAQNINIRPPVCGGCWWINDSWMDQCPRGFVVPICLSEQPPESVADCITEFLRQDPKVGCR